MFRHGTFFLGLNPRWQAYKFLPDGINTMFSAAGFWDDEKDKWRSGRYMRQCGLRWLDGGGFTILNRYGDYPFSSMNFLNLVARLNPHCYATLDYPCEPEITKASNLDTVDQRIKATVCCAAEILEYEELVPGSVPVPVIQGYSLDEYRQCIDLHERAGNIRDYMAVGSMCRRLSSGELDVLIPGIYDHALSAGASRLHFFGLKLDPNLRHLDEFIHTRDSAAALWAHTQELKDRWDGRRFARGQLEKKEALTAFIEKVEQFGLITTCTDNQPLV